MNNSSIRTFYCVLVALMLIGCKPDIYSVIIRNDGADHEQNMVNDMNAPYKKHKLRVPNIISKVSESDKIKINQLLTDLESEGFLMSATIQTKLVAQSEIVDLTKCDNDPIAFVVIDDVRVKGRKSLELKIQYACKSSDFDLWFAQRLQNDTWLSMNRFFALSQNYRIWDSSACEDGIHTLEMEFFNEKVLRNEPNLHKIRRVTMVCAEI